MTMSNLPLLREAAETGWTPLHTALMDAAHKASAQGFTTGTTNWACSMAASLRSALAQKEDGWLPMESAPKDGRTVLLAEGDYVDCGFWHDGSECHPARGEAGWFSDDDRHNLLIARNIHPTHWMNFPAPPPPSQGNDK